jgi:hypothetical protein
VENKIKRYQKKEFTMRNITVDDNMSFLEAQDLINKIQKQELADKKNKNKSVETTKWEKTSGIVVEIDHYLNRGVKCGESLYYISMQETNLERIKTGDKVECLIGHPGQHRPVAKDLKLL